MRPPISAQDCANRIQNGLDNYPQYYPQTMTFREWHYDMQGGSFAGMHFCDEVSRHLNGSGIDDMSETPLQQVVDYLRTVQD